MCDKCIETYVCITEKEKKMMQASAIHGHIFGHDRKSETHSLRLDPEAGVSDTCYSFFAAFDSCISEGRGCMPLGLTR